MPSSADTARLPLSAVASGSATRRIAYGGMLLVCATVLGLVETWLLAVSPIPWLRFGLANIAVLVALAWLGPRTAFMVSMLRVVLVGLATGSLLGPGTILASAGAMSALAAMVIVRAAGERFSVVGWSVAGAFAHVTGQFTAAAVVTGSAAVMALAPVSLVASLPLGVATGLLARSLISRVMTLA